MFMPAWGLGMGAGVLAGQNLGARQPERAARSGWLAAGFFSGIMVVCSVAIFLWAEYIVRVFSPDPALVALTAPFLRIACAGYLVNGLSSVLQQCISGVGDTVLPMVVSIVSLWGVQMPLAYFLSRFTDLGVYGVRWGLVAGIVTAAIAYTIYFKLGRWKRKKV